MFGSLAFTDAGWSSSVARWAHNPEVAGSNPVPATSGNDPRGATSGVIFMHDGNGFGNISLANCLACYLACLRSERQSSPIRTAAAVLGCLAVTRVSGVRIGL